MNNPSMIPSRLGPFLWQMVKPQKWAFFVLFFTHMAWGFSEALFPYFYKLFIDGAMHAEHHLSQLWDILAPVTYAFVGFCLSIEICFRIYDFVSAKAYPKFSNYIRETMFEYTLLHSHHYFSENFAGTIASKISRLSEASLNLIILTITVFIPIIVGFGINIVLLYHANPFFGMIVILWLSVHLSIVFISTLRMKKYSHIYSESFTALHGKIVDVLSNMTNVRLFARRTFEKRYFEKAQSQIRQHNEKMLFFGACTKTFLGFFTVIYMIAAVVGGIYLLSHQKISVGDFVLILSSLNLLGLIWFASLNLINFFQDVGTCQQSLSLIAKPHDIQDKSQASELKVVKGKIEFINVSFYYHQHQNLFQNKNLCIEGGEKVGLVGHSGSGKTTFVNLILRNYDLIDGAILIDGQNIADVTQESLRKNIAVIPQDTTLFHRTLKENIAYGQEEASDEEIIAAALIADCDEFIQNMPEKYESLVGERGVKLSGGQRQRIAIARAFLKDAHLLILDEATAALDSLTEKRIQISLKKLMAHRTTIVIAHRLSTLFEMDRILVFDQGKVIAQGSHTELLLHCEHYRLLCKTQSGGILVEDFYEKDEEEL